MCVLLPFPSLLSLPHVACTAGGQHQPTFTCLQSNRIHLRRIGSCSPAASQLHLVLDIGLFSAAHSSCTSFATYLPPNARCVGPRVIASRARPSDSTHSAAHSPSSSSSRRHHMVSNKILQPPAVRDAILANGQPPARGSRRRLWLNNSRRALPQGERRSSFGLRNTGEGRLGSDKRGCNKISTARSSTMPSPAICDHLYGTVKPSTVPGSRPASQAQTNGNPV